jgi:carnitine O-acetyltransferase
MQKLPRLPIPDPKATLAKLVASCAPLLRHMPPTEAATHMSTIQKHVQHFSTSDLPRLQDALIAREHLFKDTHKSWLSDWWLNVAYLGYRASLPNNSNFYFTFKSLPVEHAFHATPFDRASALACAAYDFYKASKRGLDPDRVGADELDMQMYGYMWRSCRVPKPKVDGMKVYPAGPDNQPGHVLVMVRDQMFSVPETILQRNDSVHVLSSILKRLYSESVGNGNGIGVLTSDDRDRWADMYAHLERIHPSNRASLDKVESALFAICVDSSSASSDIDFERNLLHANKVTCGNRWFDKNFQIIVDQSGRAGMNFDHTAMDGTVSMRLVEHVAKHEHSFLSSMKQHHRGPGMENQSVSLRDHGIDPVTFVLDKTVSDAIRRVVHDQAERDRMQLFMIETDAVSKNIAKNAKMSPDGVLQMCFHTAFFDLHKQHAATYESCQTRRFMGGRTETIRSLSSSASDFVHNRTRETLERACVQHVQVAKEASAGLGCDRHLLAWKLLSDELGIPRHSLFSDPIVCKSGHWTLSTSQISSDRTAAGFGAVVADGYGLCYSILPDGVQIRVSATEMDAQDMCRALQRAMQEVGNIIR